MTPRTRNRGLVLALTAALSAACGDDVPTYPELEVIEEVEFDPSLGIDLERMTRTNTGVYYEDLVVGTGDPARIGDWAFVTYTGWLRTGVRFDEGSFDFIVASGAVIDGSDEGVRGMAAGGVRKVVVPPGLAYGASSRPGIPAGSILVFEIRLDELR